jgi:ATP-dependent Zn protease
VLETAAWRERLFALREAPALTGGGGLALMTDAPPLLERARANSVNAVLDALYIVPARVFGLRLRLKPPGPRKEALYFIAAGTTPVDSAPGRIIALRTPTWEDRRDIFDLYLAKVAHETELDTGKARDELARITGGYSPAMIEQACALARTYAHADERTALNRSDLLEAMTTVESGTAVGAPYPKHRRRAVAIHEAGHAVCGQLYLESRVSTRLSIRRRGASGGQHQAMEVEDRFGHWRSEQVGDLIWGLGAMAAEHVFYDQTTTGVGGDIGMVTWRAGQMVGRHGMGPAPIDLSDRIADKAERETAEQRVLERFERLGTQLMHRADTETEDPAKRRLVAALLGQAFVVAWCTVRANREATDAIADRLIAAGELYGDDVTDLLDEAMLVKPDIDVLDETSWPVI